MHKTTRWISTALMVAISGAIFLGLPPTASAQRRGGVVVVEPVPVYDPFFPYWGYPYPYASYPAPRNYGYVKVNTHGQNAEIYVDGGYAAKTHKSKKLALRVGTHDIELRDSGGRSFFKERVSVMIGQTTKVDVPS